MSNNRLGSEYLNIALQYYIAARAASFAYLLPVTGNLFHHAIEMFLKFLLLNKYSAKQLQDKFGHNLEKLWKQYKLLQQDKTLNKYNALIKKLNKFEELRYSASKGYTIFIDLKKGNYSYLKESVVKDKNEYRLNLGEIDEFISKILDGRVNPKYIEGLLFLPESKKLYERENDFLFYKKR